MQGLTFKRALRGALLAELAGATLLALLLFAAPGHAASYSSCRLSAGDQQPRGGKPTYNLKLAERGTSCATARRVMRGYHRCRSRRSVSCSGRVLSRWRCTGRKTSSTSITFYATYTCTAGRAAVRGTYQQNT